MRTSFLAVLSLALFPAALFAEDKADPGPPAPVLFTKVPWKDGETLTYHISIGMLDAAEGTFSAHDRGSGWEFDLKLGSRGLLDEFYPFTGNFWCLLTKSPWRSDEYGEYRFEPKRTIKERTRIDYDTHLGTREIWMEGKSKTFPVAEDSVDDVGTMLYHIRAIDWKPGDHRVFHVYESDSEKEALIDCQARDTVAFGTYPKQTYLRLVALPGKGTHHRGKLVLWMTDDARHLPVHANLEFRYGSCTIDLVKPPTPKPARSHP